MTHRFIIAALCATFSTTAFAQQETSDSVPSKNLDEVVVEASNQQTSSNK